MAISLRDKYQVSLTEMGRIRLGERVPKQSGSGLRPDKLATFKFTSPAEHLIVEIAALYGGTPAPFSGEGVLGKQFQVVTEINVIPVYLPRQKIDPFYEQWGGRVCTRRCDGERDMIHDKPCDCDPDERKCKPTTRVNLMLADVSGPGFWRLDTHGLYAAMELSQLATMLQMATMPIPARLLLEARQRKFFNREKQKVEVRDWFTPIVILDSVTPRMLMNGGEALERAIRGDSTAQAAVESAPAARAIEAVPATPVEPDPEVIARGLAMISVATPEQMAGIRARIEKAGAPQVLVDAFRLRTEEHEVAKEEAEAEEAEAARSAVEPPAGDDVQDAELVPDVPVAPPATDDADDRAAAMMELLGVAGKLKINTKQLEAEIEGREGVSRTQATADQLRKVTAFLLERGK